MLAFKPVKDFQSRAINMKSFPNFIKNPINKIDALQQNTADIEGYFFQGADETQIAFWECHDDRISTKHTHSFDEYIVCVSGEYTAYLNDKEIILNPGDELYIPKGTEQWGKCVAGTRTVHAFGGKRIKR
jgi:quercetin dioxygenase-like cupin family protein